LVEQVLRHLNGVDNYAEIRKAIRLHTVLNSSQKDCQLALHDVVRTRVSRHLTCLFPTAIEL